jgi:hypothetical protein
MAKFQPIQNPKPKIERVRLFGKSHSVGFALVGL